MASKKLGALIKTARTDAGFTQEQLARRISGLTATDISRAERGEADLTQEQLKAIAKATGVTQKSLLEAATGRTATKKTSATKKSTTSKTAAQKTIGKTTPTRNTGTSMRVSQAEKKLVELYRVADADTKKEVVRLLKGQSEDFGDLLAGILEGVVGSLGKR